MKLAHASALALVGFFLFSCSREPAPEVEEKDPYTIHAFEKVRISSLQEEENFHRAVGAVDFGNGRFAEATFVVELESPCFPFSKWHEPDAIPPGHSWPAACDAFDRTFSFQLLPGVEGAPGLELVRAITPFGGPMKFSVDVTDIANGLRGKHAIQASIDAWPDPDGIVSGARGSWFVSARFEMVPGTPPRNVLAVVPLFNESWTKAGDEVSFGPFPFEVPEGVEKAHIEYRATGHGGPNMGRDCIGPAEEFCRRTHELFLGGRAVRQYELWRSCKDNCDVVTRAEDPDAFFDYCAQNPCASHVSARATRANWCPGQTTDPEYFSDPSLLRPGKVEAAWTINRIEEGGSWRVSGIYFAYGSQHASDL